MKVTITTTLSRRTSISLFPKIALVELDVLGREARRELWHSTPSHSKAGFEPDVVFYALTSVENGSSTLERGNGATTTERPTQGNPSR